jgi:hypothetical protein
VLSGHALDVHEDGTRYGADGAYRHGAAGSDRGIHAVRAVMSEVGERGRGTDHDAREEDKGDREGIGHASMV